MFARPLRFTDAPSPPIGLLLNMREVTGVLLRKKPWGLEVHRDECVRPPTEPDLAADARPDRMALPGRSMSELLASRHDGRASECC